MSARRDSVRISAPPRWTLVVHEDARALYPIADLLMAAAWADGQLDPREQSKALYLLARLAGKERFEDCPPSLVVRVADFDPATYDMATAADAFRALSPRERRRLVALVREVCDADGAFCLEEDRFVTALVLALALTEEDVGDLLIRVAPGLDGWAKRAFDVAFSGAFLLAAWPILLAIGLAVRLTSDGPALFKQRRYGRAGEEIEVWKFRTMRVQEDGAQVRQATRGDARVTPLGAFLRRTSLDELPQFVNVLTGQMSVVGPRPHAIAHNRHYKTQILEYMLRHKVKPGITGWAQVNGWRGETDTLDKMVARVEHDLAYMRDWTLWLDLKIVWLTVFGEAVRKNAF